MQSVFMCQGILKTQIHLKSRENICTFIIHHISKTYFQFSALHTSTKIAYTKMYVTQKLINQFLDQVEYLI